MIGLYRNRATGEFVEVLEVIPDGDVRADLNVRAPSGRALQFVVRRADSTVERWYPVPFWRAHGRSE